MAGPEGQQILSIIIAARNEANYLPRCLASLLAQDSTAGQVQVVVSANACTDATVAVAQSHRSAFASRGWQLEVIDRDEGGKIGALNSGDAAAMGDVRLYLDADIVCDADLLGQLRTALAKAEATYATGRLRIPAPRSWVSRQYGRFWMRLPFVEGGCVGAGLFAVNAAGRARWGLFPTVIADDSFARLQFAPSERIEVPAGYAWPVIEGLRGLVRVRRRQDEGMRQLFRLYPQLAANEGKKRLGPTGIARLALRDPVGFAVYATILLLARSRPAGADWSRGR